MGRRIVVGLDGSEYSANAIRIACAAARTFDATIVGVAVVDLPAIDSTTRGAGIGSYGYARQMREQKLEHARDRVKTFLDDFESKCTDAGARFEAVSHEGVPCDCIANEARFADVIIVGARTHFHFETQDEPGDTLRRLVEIGVCPVVAMPRFSDLPKRALITYDGSVQSARSMKAYAHLISTDPAARGIVLLHVGEEGGQDKDARLNKAQRYLEGYGFSVELMVREGRAGNVIKETAEKIAPCVVVLGSYGRRGFIRNLLFGSTAEEMISVERFPLFLYH